MLHAWGVQVILKYPQDTCGISTQTTLCLISSFLIVWQGVRTFYVKSTKGVSATCAGVWGREKRKSYLPLHVVTCPLKRICVTIFAQQAQWVAYDLKILLGWPLCPIQVSPFTHTDGPYPPVRVINYWIETPKLAKVTKTNIFWEVSFSREKWNRRRPLLFKIKEI